MQNKLMPLSNQICRHISTVFNLLTITDLAAYLASAPSSFHCASHDIVRKILSSPKAIFDSFTETISFLYSLK
ncbi:hypothetical protein Droror1_Dr00027533, partial [Drosera rotundifolia]